MMSGRFDHLPPTQEMLRQRGASAGERALHERLDAAVQRRLAQAQDLDRQMAERATTRVRHKTTPGPLPRRACDAVTAISSQLPARPPARTPSH